MDSSVAEFLASNQTTRVRIPIRAFKIILKNKMKNVDNTVGFCPLRHPSLEFKKGICFYSSSECQYRVPEKYPIYNSIGRDYSLRIKEYQGKNQEQIKKE